MVTAEEARAWSVTTTAEFQFAVFSGYFSLEYHWEAVLDLISSSHAPSAGVTQTPWPSYCTDVFVFAFERPRTKRRDKSAR
jgi:hypothetical protein